MMAELNYIILKINGIDVSQLPQNEAVKMFLTASEPIVLEVRRKFDVFAHKNLTNNAIDVDIGIHESFDSKLEDLKISPSANKQTATKCNETNITTTMTSAEAYTLENELMLTLTPSTASADIIDKTETPSSTRMGLPKSTQTDDSIFFSLQHQNAKDTADRLIEQEHHLFEQCLAPEIDIEEITLRKSDSNERLGLTVCYSGGGSNNGSGNNNGALSGSDDNETCTEVYISDIHPDSIAGRDGRLRQGDQILQINGKDIKNKEETESLMAENNNAVTLLVSRYLCADEDDFNDPSVADIDVEDDDDEDDEEYYDDSNLAYENCFIANDYLNVVDELDKVLLSQVAAQQQDSEHATEKSSIFNTSLTVLKPATSAPSLPAVAAIATSSAKSKCIASTTTTTNDNNIKNSTTRDAEQNSTYSGNGELNVKPAHTKKNDQHATSTQAVVSASNATTIQSGDYETEHIYETIPEDSESEPFYCSPYESTFYMTAVGSCSSAATDVLQLQQQKQRVAQWLGLKSHTSAATTSMATATTAPRQSMRSSSGCGRSLTHYDASNFLAHNRNGTLRSAITTATNGSSNSGGGCIGSVIGSTNNTETFQNDEQDNSSSAYNTGGSNNSVTPLILVLNQNNRSDTLTCCLDNEQMMAAASRAIKSQRFLSPKDNITSPKNSSFSLGRNGNGGQLNRGNSDLPATETFVRTTSTPLDGTQQQQLVSPKTMYTNEANLYQTMLLQQHLFRKAITQQQNQNHVQQEQQQVHCPQFTAPNLSQYHFVSSQEVSAAHVNTTATAATTASTTVVVAHKNSNEETTMVWKVKRRPDGTRYIVRRPARNRLLRDRSVRLNTDRVRNNEITTTEEDTVSEVKTGRYWSKEERKKHIERARERRQQHQRDASGPRTFMSTTTMRISDRTALKLQQQQQRERSLQRDQKQQHQYLQQQQQFMSQQQASTRLHRQGSLKASQHHQLQFNSVTTQQQQQQFPTSTLNVSGACTNIPTDIKSKQLPLPCKNVSSYAHTICSPVDVLPPGPITTAVASPGGGAVIANLMTTGVADAISYDTVPIIATQNFQSINDSSKIKDLLSVTTV